MCPYCQTPEWRHRWKVPIDALGWRELPLEGGAQEKVVGAQAYLPCCEVLPWGLIAQGTNWFLLPPPGRGLKGCSLPPAAFCFIPIPLLCLHDHHCHHHHLLHLPVGR